VPEYRRTLEVSLKLQALLQQAGVRVVMVRTANNVNVANSERAKIGNREKADLTIRVHFDSNAKSSVKGISTLYPSGNKWCAPIEAPSKRAAQIVQAAVTKATGAPSRGVVGRSDMTGFNWSTVPTIIVENGFLSNPDEDKLVATTAYQNQLAAGLAAGVMQYLGK
jgi:N-acetylmuramoyl-L-alanine amidase